MKGKRSTEEPFKLFSNLITGAVLREQVTVTTENPAAICCGPIECPY